MVLFADSIVGLSWMLLWLESMYCRILSGLVRVESLDEQDVIHVSGVEG